MPSVYITTYGCQMNERDSEQVAAQLVSKGYTLVRSEATADVILLNTCSVRDMAEQKALGKMATLAADVRRNRPDVVLGFMGCMAQSRGEELIDRLPDVDLVVGTQKFHRAPEYIDELLAGRREKSVAVAEEVGGQSTIREYRLNGASAKSVTGFVSIMQGCNQYCTFCIVPYTRGGERSRSIAEIVAECRELVGQGVKEITLLGQIVTSYGKREIPVRDGKSAFVQLLEAVHEIEGLERIRFTSPHPKGYGDDLVEAYGRLLEVINGIAARKYREYLGQTVEILVEGPSKKKPFRMMGRTRANKIVVFDGSERHRGQVLDVKVTRAGSFTLYGDPAILNVAED